MKMLKHLAFVILYFLGTCAVGDAQTPEDQMYVYEAFTENGVLAGGRAAGMGGAQIAAGNDGSVVWYNPALLTRIRRPEISGTLAHQKLTNETSIQNGVRQESNLSNTRLGSLWGVLPVPTYRGGMTLGFAINRVRNFDNIFRYATSQAWLNNPNSTDGFGGGEDERGNLWAISFGGAVEISPRASIGLSLEIYDGTDSWTSFYSSTSTADNYRYDEERSIEDGYTGISGKVGLTYTVNNYLNLSGIIGFPSSISVDQLSDEYISDNQGYYDEYHSSVSYRYTLPFWFGAGAAVRHRGFMLAGDITYTDYTQLEYVSGLDGMMIMNRMVKENYKDAFTYRVGVEYHIEQAGIRLRGGYYQEPIGFTARPIETEPHFFTLGAGFVIDRAVNVDLAFLTGSWERDDPDIGSEEKYNVNRFMVTISYRM
jgi:long-subunit fatty acid transport protein